jgi:hypothetical protein
VARTYGESRRWVHELVRRFHVEGEAGPGAEVTATSGEPEQVPDAREEEIVELRMHLAEEGLDAGALTIAFHLEHRTMSGDTWGTMSRDITEARREGVELPTF